MKKVIYPKSYVKSSVYRGLFSDMWELSQSEPYSYRELYSSVIGRNNYEDYAGFLDRDELIDIIFELARRIYIRGYKNEKDLTNRDSIGIASDLLENMIGKYVDLTHDEESTLLRQLDAAKNQFEEQSEKFYEEKKNFEKQFMR